MKFDSGEFDNKLSSHSYFHLDRACVTATYTCTVAWISLNICRQLKCFEQKLKRKIKYIFHVQNTCTLSRTIFR
jgi:hypothetical protein